MGCFRFALKQSASGNSTRCSCSIDPSATGSGKQPWFRRTFSIRRLRHGSRKSLIGRPGRSGESRAWACGVRAAACRALARRAVGTSARPGSCRRVRQQDEQLWRRDVDSSRKPWRRKASCCRPSSGDGATGFRLAGCWRTVAVPDAHAAPHRVHAGMGARPQHAQDRSCRVSKRMRETIVTKRAMDVALARVVRDEPEEAAGCGEAA